MGLTKRQEEMISQMVIAESRAAHESQQERHRILEGIDDADDVVIKEAPDSLEPGFKAVVQDLVETFLSAGIVYEGHEWDGGAATQRAASYLKRLVENDLMEVRQMLRDGDFSDEE